ncbi:hypothetical protein F4604DRAFT_1918984 [Suillus subluteus]|nr:hypothetical protein F4604DRAFT_1918984 [Suillus subluteus]
MDSIFTDSFSSDGELSMPEDDDMLQSSSMDSGKQVTVVADGDPDKSEPVEVLDKRGPGRPRKQKEAPPAPQNAMISYSLVMYSFEQMKKPKTKRSEETAIIKLYQDEPFDTLKAQILKCISESLKPKKLDYDDYKIMFTVLRHQTAPLSLKKTAEYEHLVECAVRMKTPAVKLLIEALKDQTASKKRKNGDPEGDGAKASDSDTSQSSGSNSDSQKGKKKKKKKKLVKELPLNIELSAQIKLLQNRYTCNKPGCLTSGYCYILLDNNAHFTLSHQHLSVWAAALAAKPPITTLDRPPNHKEFDTLSSNLLSKSAPLIQRRLAEQNAAQSTPDPPASTVPTINFNLPNDIFSFLRPASAPLPTTPGQTNALVNSADMPVLPVSARPGPDLSLANFCAVYDLSPDIHAKLTENGYTGTRTIRYIVVSELKEMGFKNGEIAAMKDAVARWANGTVTERCEG